jgi:hypothetical protein
MWIVAFESLFGYPESVNVMLDQNLERITARLRGACWWSKALPKINKVSCVSIETLQLA